MDSMHELFRIVGTLNDLITIDDDGNFHIIDEQGNEITNINDAQDFMVRVQTIVHYIGNM